ncbi:MAG: cell division protein FtsH, partial [Corynebacterium sp.]|nr:cell division protein FtsH [Corynebacterium sp.]
WGGQDDADAGHRHPGEISYGDGSATDSPESRRPEQRGFRLPDNEQPEHPWPSENSPTRNLGRSEGNDAGGRHHRRDDEREQDHSDRND